ncbi:MAG TPA: response regulator [Terriglobia bacterium]|nr:response regulator [Terriglobia bacterium]
MDTVVPLNLRSSAHESEAGGKLQILHLEDDALDADLMVATLMESNMECDVVRVDNRADFISKLQDHRFDLVISDLSLPTFDGRSALDIIRHQWPNLPFIFLSGTIGEDAAVESLLGGATDYVLKHKLTRLVPAVQRAYRESKERKLRRLTEEKLALASTQLQNLFDNLDEVIFSLDTVAPALLQVSPSCEKVLGYPPQIFMANLQLWEECIFSHDRRHIPGIEADLKAGRAVQWECRIVYRNGAIGWIEARLKPVIDQSGRLVRVDGVLSDVSERKRAEEALRRSEERYRQLFDNNPHPMWVYEQSTQAFLAANDAAVELYGYSQEEFLNMTIADLNTAAGQDTSLESASKDGHAFDRVVRSRHRRKDGTTLHVEVASHELTYAGKSARLVLAMDIREKIEIETRLLRSQRIETIGTLASGIAHDLNNILAPILMGVELLKEQSTDPSSIEVLDTVAMSARRGADLVKQVLTFARGIQGQAGPLKLHHLSSDIEKMMGQTLPKSIQMVNTVSKDLWSVSGDGSQIHQMLMNLCINARDAMASGGVLTVSARNETVDRVWIRRGSELKPGNYLLVEVADTGDGIPSDIIDKIFDPFFTTKPPGKGTGLGLSTVQMIVNGLGGFLDVRSEVGRGSTFSIYLPAIVTEQVSLNSRSTSAVPLGHGELILIVDDEAAIRDISKAALEAYGYRVLIATNGVEGLNVFIRHKDEIKAVLSDMNMPEMDGKSMLEYMDKLSPGIRFVATSGMAQPPGLAALVQASKGRVSLRKPFTSDDLLQSLDAALRAEL